MRSYYLSNEVALEKYHLTSGDRVFRSDTKASTFDGRPIESGFTWGDIRSEISSRTLLLVETGAMGHEGLWPQAATLPARSSLCVQSPQRNFRQRENKGLCCVAVESSRRASVISRADEHCKQMIGPISR